jgi:hypothetical protein
MDRQRPWTRQTRCMLRLPNGSALAWTLRRWRDESCDDELYVFTHPVMRGVVEERFRAILAAFDRAAATPV